MKNVYAITRHSNSNLSSNGLLNQPFVALFETEELATKQLRKWADEIKAGKWADTTLIKWHDADEDEVTWMKIKRVSICDGSETMWDYAIETLPLKESESEFC